MNVHPNIRFFVVATAALIAATLAVAPGWAAQPASVAVAVKETSWDELVPKDWDPMNILQGSNSAPLSDNDPKVMDMMRKMREIWDNAPTNSKMDGVVVKLPGYVVPLEEVRGELKEFLLVPYYGACIHTPPPPANQIVHVLTSKSAKGLRMMDAVWVTGTLRALRQESSMGMSGYTMESVAVERYTVPKK
jgi:hypothetical protein